MPSATEYMELRYEGFSLRYAARTASRSDDRNKFHVEATMKENEAKIDYGAPPPDGLPQLLGMDIAWSAL